MIIKKYIPKYEVWLELHNSKIRIYDHNRENYFVLGQVTKDGIERNRSISKEKSQSIGLLYKTAERYFCHNKDSLNKITARFVWLDYWIELHNLEVRLYPTTGEEHIVIGKLCDEAGIKMDKVFRSFIFKTSGDGFRFYEIAMRLFAVREKEIRKHLREQRLQTKRELIKKALEI